MKLHELKAAEGSRRVRNRVGRGAATGNGKTSGRGQKGQKARLDGKAQQEISHQDLLEAQLLQFDLSWLPPHP